MPLIAADRSMLLLIDYQQRLLPSIHDADSVLANARRLGEAARLVKVPVLRTEQNPQGLGATAESLAGYGNMVEKRSFGSCATPAFLKAIGTERTLVVAGCETHVCLLQTVLGLCALGRQVHVVADACGSRTPLNRQAALERMRAHGADIVTTEMVLFEWLGSCDHAAFRSIIDLIR